MLCYWGLDSAIERGTIKASICLATVAVQAWALSALCERISFPERIPHPFSFSVQEVITLTQNMVTIVTPRQEIVPSSLSLCCCFLEEGHVWRHCHPSLERFIRHNTMVYQFDKYIVNDYYILLLQYTMVFTNLLQRIPWYILSLLS